MFRTRLVDCGESVASTRRTVSRHTMASSVGHPPRLTRTVLRLDQKHVGRYGRVATFRRSIRRRRWQFVAFALLPSVVGGCSSVVPCRPRRFVDSVEACAASDSYLVDPASSHMLVSKIKPCMSKHRPLHGEAANGSLGHP